MSSATGDSGPLPVPDPMLDPYSDKLLSITLVTAEELGLVSYLMKSGTLAKFGICLLYASRIFHIEIAEDGVPHLPPNDSRYGITWSRTLTRKLCTGLSSIGSLEANIIAKFRR
ncbi:hypothetical protein AJ80_00451 [Polytolypa hystricis UAMH7299]|uniref:Uncharacterized protein n=1 Tax=Polytolypa hystricis (strain UAMH7299) TaxID=1447883 RepID=A0A2B7Z3G3_POLH7|nr:hypothetical protein AJ80_00451 [Polytolypa hystricis UAMH7299]